MNSLTHPRSFQHPSGRSLSGPVSPDFEEFYRAALRYRSGMRLRSLEVAQRYSDWAKETGAAGMNLRQIKRAMTNIGHRHLRSNITYFGDVQLATDAPDLADNFPAAASFDEPKRSILGRIDRIGVELEQLRREVKADRDSRQAHPLKKGR